MPTGSMPNETVQPEDHVMSNFMETVKSLGVFRIGVMAAVAVGLMLFFIFVSLRVSTPDMTLLYDELSTRESTQITGYLEEQEIPYRVSEGGDKIMVSKQEVGRARMLLAQEGLPNGGSMGYEIFDQEDGFGTTNFEQNVKQLRALQGELARTISSLDQIRASQVHLVLPQRELFSRENRSASGSVFVELAGNNRLEPQQISAIRYMVASAVPQLNAKNITIIDGDGNLLARGGEERGILGGGSNAEEMRAQYEERLISAVEDMVGRVVGFNKVRANVAADFNFDQVTENAEIYDPESQVARSSQLNEENIVETEPPPEGATIENNLPGLDGQFNPTEGPKTEENRVEEVTNFEISRTVRNIVSQGGSVERLSVAVLVDGNYTTNDNGERVYEPRSDRELEQIGQLVRTAIGYDEMRGDEVEIVNMRFADVQIPDDTQNLLFGFERSSLLDLAETFVLALVAILVVLLVLQPLVGRLVSDISNAREQAGSDERMLEARGKTPALAGPAGRAEIPSFDEHGSGTEEDDDEDLIDMQQVEGKVRASSLRKVGDIVENHPNETVNVLRNWMTQEG